MRKIVSKKQAFAVIAFLAILGFLSGCGSSRGASNKDVTVQAAPQEFNLIGHWSETSGPDGVKFTADIYKDSIQIWSQYGTSGGIFWMGSFQPADGVVGTVSSLADQDAMANQIFASNETAKVFNYSNGELTFDYSIIGVHSTIHMSRSN